MTESSKKMSLGEAAMFLSLSFAMAGLGLLLRGLVLEDMWTWFVVQFGVRQIGMAHAIGLSTLIGFVTYRETEYAWSQRSGWSIIFDASIALLVPPIVFWLIGRCIVEFM